MQVAAFGKGADLYVNNARRFQRDCRLIQVAVCVCVCVQGREGRERAKETDKKGGSRKYSVPDLGERL